MARDTSAEEAPRVQLPLLALPLGGPVGAVASWFRSAPEPDPRFHVAAGAISPPRFDILLYFHRDGPIQSLIETLKRKGMLHANTTLPRAHLSIVSNIQVDERHAEAVKAVVQSDAYQKAVHDVIRGTLGANGTIPSSLVERRLQLRHPDPNAFTIMGNPDGPFKDAFFAATFDASLYNNAGGALDVDLQQEEAERYKYAMSHYQFGNLDPMLAVLRSTPLWLLMETLKRNDWRGYAHATDPLVVEAEDFDAVSGRPRSFRVMDAQKHTCFFKAPSYEKNLFDSRQQDTWRPHVSLFRLKHVPRGHSVALDAVTNVSGGRVPVTLRHVDQPTRRQVIKELLDKIGQLGESFPDQQIVDPNDRLVFEYKDARLS